jgi:hypothetical protein
MSDTQAQPQYKLAISDTVVVPVKFQLNDDGIVKKHAFSLMCKRLTSDELVEAFKERGEKQIHDFMSPLVNGWRDQRLVQNLDGTPADFTAGALEMMFGVAGVAKVAFDSYQSVLAAKEKN